MIKIDDIGIDSSAKRSMPWKATPVGKSFLVPKTDWPERQRNRLSSSAAYHWGSGNFSVLAEGDGYRVYRVKDRPSIFDGAR